MSAAEAVARRSNLQFKYMNFTVFITSYACLLSSMFSSTSPFAATQMKATAFRRGIFQGTMLQTTNLISKGFVTGNEINCPGDTFHRSSCGYS